MVARLCHLWLAFTTLLMLLFGARQRRLFDEMRAFVRRLPQALAAPLPEALAILTPPTSDLGLPASALRRLADLAALLDRRSPLGLCLRRSLVRYHFLRRAGLPLVLNFGARFKGGTPDREIAGHAWVTLNGKPYFEDGENYRGFTVMLKYPQSEK
jgi:transglutaminase superfamily protein